MGSSMSTHEDGKHRPYNVIDEQGESSVKTTTRQPTQSGNDVVLDEFADIDEILKDFDFPFENLLLEGGGAQGNAYIGPIIVRNGVKMSIGVNMLSAKFIHSHRLNTGVTRFQQAMGSQFTESYRVPKL
ncbi:uncharacterized protein LOC115925217 [Strongylocentrotus purpuratus]|uniref:Uncharacterized protein n=1 Tax=Strongylocentrotus purpuratus TaxID=7668 RepID=A0A7M7P185_STRPU|nr:uncharacterized protein LOC115925217 [Strongylocentrotus purpuratus]